ncbi:MAG: hypothetical protein GWO20_08790 [Candidatus Korarchaeota archaeon]|nr:hypothetical protein [Candidatus Korarchaeota archaeon]NIU83519.1 hypothetical protein [Candidatus Thorarchaeota archaeon]NIW13784.1 hypothetical protein [Candidatus Thorarchaeota archaeon]NIW51912.1 hypothetical protein [Candidatus Korarchaeota archaeon]
MGNIPYRWQIWYKFEEGLANDFIYAMDEACKWWGTALAVATLLTPFTGVAGATIVAALAVKVAFKSINLGEFKEAQDHSGGKLVYFLDIWLFVSTYKTKWLENGRIETLIKPDIQIGPAQSYAAQLPSSWTYAGTRDFDRESNEWFY